MKWVISNSPAFFFLLLIILLTVYQVRSMRATPPGMRRYSPNGEGKVLFDDIGGIDTAKAEILSTVDTIKNWKKYSDK